jgi:hypothetical protein
VIEVQKERRRYHIRYGGDRLRGEYRLHLQTGSDGLFHRDQESHLVTPGRRAKSGPDRELLSVLQIPNEALIKEEYVQLAGA